MFPQTYTGHRPYRRTADARTTTLVTLAAVALPPAVVLTAAFPTAALGAFAGLLAGFAARR